MFKCESCLEEYPNKWIIDGKTYYIYNSKSKRRDRSYCFICRPPGEASRKSLKLKHRTEKRCSKCKEIKSINCFSKRKYKNGESFDSWCIKCKTKKNTEISRNIKKQCVEYKGGKCEKCGYNRSVKAMDFHHKDSTQKDFRISKNNNWSLEQLKPELDKCELLCANCHREIHDTELTL